MNQWYSTVECDNTVPDPFVADRVEPEDFDDIPFFSGQPVTNWTCSLTLQASSAELDGDPDDVLQHALGIPVFSKRLQTALVEEGFHDLQFLPIQVLRPDMSQIDGFAIANILRLVPCLDWEKSQYERDRRRKGECSSISKLVLVRSAVEGLDLFRMKEFDVMLFVSRRFKELFERKHFTGYSFHPVRVE